MLAAAARTAPVLGIRSIQRAFLESGQRAAYATGAAKGRAIIHTHPASLMRVHAGACSSCALPWALPCLGAPCPSAEGSRIKEPATDQDVEAAKKSLAESGKVSVWDYTATWCGPCEWLCAAARGCACVCAWGAEGCMEVQGGARLLMGVQSSACCMHDPLL